jgi:dihydropteroate synthase
VSGAWYPAPARTLLARDHDVELGSRPWLMGIVNASPESFSDGGRHTTLAAQARLAERLLAAGADILDVGGASARTDIAPIDAEQEIERVVPLIDVAAGELGAIVSVDTYRPAVARAAIAAGAAIVNDVSGLRDVAMARLCAQTGAALVVMHTLAPPGRRLQAADSYGDVVAEVTAFLRERIDVAVTAGVRPDQLIVDPGPDFSKTPSQSIELLAGIGTLHELQRPLLLAASRKDFIGALTRRAPRDRLGGTLAAVAHGVARGAHIFRVHDVSAVVDFLTVSAALAGDAGVPRGLALSEELRYDRLARPLG